MHSRGSLNIATTTIILGEFYMDLALSRVSSYVTTSSFLSLSLSLTHSLTLTFLLEFSCRKLLAFFIFSCTSKKKSRINLTA